MNLETKYNKESEIYKYFQIDNKIEYLENRKKVIQINFDSRNFASHLEYSELGIASVGFKVGDEVVILLSTLEAIDERIYRYKYAQNHFKKYIQSLNHEITSRLLKKYSNINFSKEEYTEFDDAVYDEIQEIKESMMYRFGIWYGRNSIIWDKEEVHEILEAMDKDVAL